MKRMMVLAMLAVLLAGSSALAATPLGGLAVALSPGGNLLTAAGDNRVLYVLDPGKMEVSQRIWLGVCILDLQFNKDGSVLLAEDTDGSIHAIDTKTWQIQKKMQKAGLMSAAQAADLMAGLNPDYNGHSIHFLSMTDLSEKGKISFAKGQKVMTMGLDAAGGKLAVLLESAADESEPKGAKPPADLRGTALEEFRLKNDGRTAMFMVFKVPDGTRLSEHKLYYSPGSGGWKTFFHGDSVLTVNYSNLNAQISLSGEVSLFQLDNSFNYGMGISADQKIFMSGGLAHGTYTKVEGMVKSEFKPDRLAGWPEYFKGFAVASDGTAYGSTSGYRIIRIKAGGTVDKSFPVF